MQDDDVATVERRVGSAWKTFGIMTPEHRQKIRESNRRHWEQKREARKAAGFRTLKEIRQSEKVAK